MVNSIKLAIIALFVGGILGAANAAQTPKPIAVFPVKIIDNRTHILFDGPDGPIPFLIDTGASTSVFFDDSIVPSTAYEDGEQTSIMFPAVGRKVLGRRVSELKLRAGDETFISRGGLLLGDDTTDLKAALDADFAGILGQELFERYVVEIDPYDEEMRLYKNGTDLSRYHEIEHYIRLEGRTPYITFRSQLPWERGLTRKNMLLDSGYPGGMVFWSRRHFMQTTSRTERKEMVADGTGVLTAATVSFGSLYFENMPIFIASSVPDQAQGRDGLIGASILSQYHYVIDFANSRLLMSPILDSDGNPIQIVDGAVYTPNNEDFKVKFFGPKISIHPVMTLYANRAVMNVSGVIEKSDNN